MRTLSAQHTHCCMRQNVARCTALASNNREILMFCGQYYQQAIMCFICSPSQGIWYKNETLQVCTGNCCLCTGISTCPGLLLFCSLLMFINYTPMSCLMVTMQSTVIDTMMPVEMRTMDYPRSKIRTPLEQPSARSRLYLAHFDLARSPKITRLPTASASLKVLA